MWIQAAQALLWVPPVRSAVAYHSTSYYLATISSSAMISFNHYIPVMNTVVTYCITIGPLAVLSASKPNSYNRQWSSLSLY
jgi:hypothetical protein